MIVSIFNKNSVNTENLVYRYILLFNKNKKCYGIFYSFLTDYIL